MSNSNKSNKKEITVEQRILARNSMFSLLTTYSRFFLTIVTSFIMARIISQEEWGFLIISLSYISLISVILTFLPPSLGYTINYYVPKYSALKQYNKLRSFIKKAIFLRFLFVISIFICAIIFFIPLAYIIRLNLNGNYNLLFILSPLIIINGLDVILNNLTQAINKFNITFYLVVLNYSINTLGLLILAFFIHPINIEAIALISLFSNLIPFLINIFIIYIRFKFKLKRSEEQELSTKEFFKIIFSYGTPVSVKNFIDSLTLEIRTQAIGFIESADIVTGYNIAKNYSHFSSETISTLSNPTAIAFTGLITTEKKNEIQRIYRVIFHYLLFIVLLISGILFFFPDFYLFFIYGENYLVFSLFLKIMLISIVFNIPNIFFFSLIRATNKVKYLIQIYLGITAIRLPLFLFSVIYYGIIGGLIGILISNIITFIIYIIINRKMFSMKTNIIKAIVQYLIFFLSIAIIISLDILFLNDINYKILSSLNLLYFEDLNVFNIIFFIILYLGFNLIFKIITSNDIENIEAFFDKDTFRNKVIRIGLKYLKKITRK